MKLTIKLPYLPPPTLSPNYQPSSKGARWAFIKAKQALQNDIYFLAIDALLNSFIQNRPAFERITITYTFTCAVNRRRDSDNWIARMKAAQDALVQAGVVSDDTHDKVKVADPVFVVDKANVGTTIEIEGVVL